jgi:phosphopantetheinyl transferase
VLDCLAVLPRTCFRRSNNPTMISLYGINHEPAHDSACNLCLLVFDANASPSELAHVARLRSQTARLEYRLSHGALRLVLAREARRLPDQIRFQRTSNGKPVCIDGPFFNLSHTCGLTVIAVSAATEVGVDVEALPRDPDNYGSVPIVPAEEDSALLPCLSGIAAHAEIILWTIKEAALKLTGEVMVDPSHLAVRQVRRGRFKLSPARIASAPFPEVFVRLVPMKRSYVVALATFEDADLLRIKHPDFSSE